MAETFQGFKGGEHVQAGEQRGCRHRYEMSLPGAFWELQVNYGRVRDLGMERWTQEAGT